MSELKVYVMPIKTNMFGKMIVGQSYYLKSEADKVIAHHKYKRCLAMATFCHVSSVLCEGPDSLFYRRWFHKWYELAERFKETK